ncbi:PP2C family protein-serine/threonine phosphatase [Sphingomonas radiodurans]|uniref:PP2C family protein-serine/threonine phosphatase n=1 Tax=Sphingomonas radiodurans TaxID=2890321 RepID=UPI001E50F6C3|nr:protein phosphatase 2C domain-containing protein [Sphingomonas radiodurans]WBH15038.1 protein phosphatase 2C domain-containing protein [Sphingomonas radiodurans]
MIAIERPTDLRARTNVMRSTARSHVGLVRRINEDRVFDWPDGGLWAVSDGMGGHRGGDLAAQSVIDALRRFHTSGPPDTPDAVLAALAGANRMICARNSQRGEHAGATVVALSIFGTTIHLAWAGDSRCYRIRDRAVQLLTRDHSLVQDLVDAGLFTLEAAAHHPQANVITRALGVDSRCEIECRLVEFEEGDRFLLCSDGLSRSLAEADLLDNDLQALADDLVAKALQRDGADNISLVLIEPQSIVEY